MAVAGEIYFSPLRLGKPTFTVIKLFINTNLSRAHQRVGREEGVPDVNVAVEQEGGGRAFGPENSESLPQRERGIGPMGPRSYRRALQTKVLF